LVWKVFVSFHGAFSFSGTQVKFFAAESSPATSLGGSGRW
jgi:hypothetical protein